jgi:predicted dehydrogenase
MRVGLVGLGRFGKLHASVLSRAPGVELVGICDPKPAELRAVGDHYGVAGRYAAFDDLLAEEALDAVFIVSPEPLHAEQAIAALERGLPVFLEKPLALTYDEGTRVVAAAGAAGVPLQLGFLLRFEVQHALLKQEIAAGRFGDLISLRVKRNVSRAWFPDYGDRAHPVYETLIHDIDLALWFAASACTSVYAIERNVSGLTYPDACFALARFESGATAILETSWFVPAGAPANVLTPTWHGTIDAELEVVGTERSARIRLLDSGLAIWQPDLTAVPDSGMWPELNGQIAGALREEDLHFLQRVRTGQASAIASVEDALAGIRLAEAIVASAASGTEVDLPAAR